jgi:hypothetical protein
MLPETVGLNHATTRNRMLAVGKRIELEIREEIDHPGVVPVALAQKGELNEAISQFQEVLRVRPDFSPAQNNLARARALLQQDDGGE